MARTVQAMSQRRRYASLYTQNFWSDFNREPEELRQLLQLYLQPLLRLLLEIQLRSSLVLVPLESWWLGQSSRFRRRPPRLQV